MKKKWLILMMTQIMLLAVSEQSLAPPYSVICIDPGHGGPGASKYGPNGDGHGTCGPVLHLFGSVFPAVSLHDAVDGWEIMES